MLQRAHRHTEHVLPIASNSHLLKFRELEDNWASLRNHRFHHVMERMTMENPVPWIVGNELDLFHVSDTN
ncbi:MAG: hypothetical protein SFV81_08525 [Pirellulaceae bacterium]|nr:hypothetical protein [Pirellulaceae bacterium]